MVVIQKCEIQHLISLLETSRNPQISGFVVPQNEEIAPKFLLEFAINKLNQDADNAFWWSPRLIIANKEIVGTIGFKNLPNTTLANKASQLVLEKNGFNRTKNKIDSKDGEVWVWQKAKDSNIQITQ